MPRSQRLDRFLARYWRAASCTSAKNVGASGPVGLRRSATVVAVEPSAPGSYCTGPCNEVPSRYGITLLTSIMYRPSAVRPPFAGQKFSREAVDVAGIELQRLNRFKPGIALARRQLCSAPWTIVDQNIGRATVV